MSKTGSLDYSAVEAITREWRENENVKKLPDERVRALVVDEVRADLKLSGVIIPAEGGGEVIAPRFRGTDGFNLFEWAVPVGRSYWISREEVEGLLT